MPELTLESLAPPVRAFFHSLPKSNGETVLVEGGRAVFRIQPTTDAVPDAPKVQEHLAYLKRMADEKVIDPKLANVARTVWYAVWVETGGRLPVPAASALPDGPVEYHWESTPHQLSIEILADEPCHWFYRDKTTGESWGVEAPITDGVPAPFLAYLQRLLPSAG